MAGAATTRPLSGPGRRSISHGGGIPGFITASSYLPEEDLFVAVFANSDEPATSPELVLRRLAGMALGRPYASFTKVAVDAAAMEPLLGVYALPNGGGERRFFAREGRLYTQRTGSGPLEVFAAGNDRFFYGNASLSWFTMRRAADGAHMMEFRPNGEDTIELATRSGPVPAEAAAVTVPRETLARYAGRYDLPPIGVFTIALTEAGTLTAQLTGQPALPLVAISATEFRTEGGDAKVTFEAGADASTKVTIHQGGQSISGARQPGGS